MEVRRAAMVATQLRAAGIADPRVLAAMGRVPREEFARPEDREAAYEPRSLPLGPGQTISQPLVVAAMTEAAAPGRADHVLEIGTGSGYQAAILSLLCSRVWTVERDAALAQAAAERLLRLGYANVEVIVGDGALGHPERAPYDAILVTAAADSVPRPLVEQLAEGGRLAIPLRVAGAEHQELRVLTRKGRELLSRTLFAVSFVPLV